jgi:putative transposase
MLNIDRSGYYAWLKRKPNQCAKANERVDNKIIDIFKRHQHRYGGPRITEELLGILQ